jgi:CubicO group peptidase (beta-lactamase class C family)
MMRTPVLSGAVVLAVSLASGAAAQSTSPLATSPFESYLELLRQQAGIPGISAAIVQNGEIVWERGLGLQNVEARIRATPDTPYPILGLSETLASTLILECAESRLLSLEDPVSAYGVSLPEPGVTVRHVLTHTSASDGDTFHYDAERFAQLTRVVESCIPQPYRKTIAVNLFERLAMKDSVPGRDVQDNAIVAQDLFAASVQDRYKAILDRVAVPYKVDKKGRSSRSQELPLETITSASGVISTVRDLARFDAALDSALLLRAETLALAWTNKVGRDRTLLPTGLGWFVQRYNNERRVELVL